MEINCGDFVLREWKMTDLKSLVDNANEPDIANNLRDKFPSPYTLEDGKNWLEHVRYEKPQCNFAILVGGNAVGGIGLVIGDDIERLSAEIGYWLGKNYWGRGIMTKAVARVVQYAFVELRMIRIFALPFSHNMVSRRVLEKNQFTVEGVLKNSAIKYEKVYDQVLYAKIK